MGYETLANIPSMSLSENWAARIPTKLETRKLFIKMANLGIWGVTEKMEYFWFQWVCSKRSLWKPIICRSCSGGFCHGFKPISTNFVRKSPLYILYILYYCYYIYIYIPCCPIWNPTIQLYHQISPPKKSTSITTSPFGRQKTVCLKIG